MSAARGRPAPRRITYDELRRRVAASRPTWIGAILDGPAPHPRIAALALHALIRIGADTDDIDVVVEWDGGWAGIRHDRSRMMFESDEDALASGAAHAYSAGVDFDAPLEELGR